MKEQERDRIAGIYQLVVVLNDVVVVVLNDWLLVVLNDGLLVVLNDGLLALLNDWLMVLLKDRLLVSVRIKGLVRLARCLMSGKHLLERHELLEHHELWASQWLLNLTGKLMVLLRAKSYVTLLFWVQRYLRMLLRRVERHLRLMPKVATDLRMLLRSRLATLTLLLLLSIVLFILKLKENLMLLLNRKRESRVPLVKINDNHLLVLLAMDVGGFTATIKVNVIVQIWSQRHRPLLWLLEPRDPWHSSKLAAQRPFVQDDS